MHIQKFDNQDDWKAARVGKVTGTVLKDIVVLRGSAKKIGYWQLLADRLCTPADDENPMERGLRLEEEAIKEFTEITGKEVNTDLVIWSRDDNGNVALSPDGYIETDGKVTEAVEVKCLNSAKHIEAKVTGKVPKEYEFQVLQYFIVNDDLEQLHVVLYDPRFIENLQTVIITVDRETLKDDIETYRKYQEKMLAEIEELATNLSF